MYYVYYSDGYPEDGDQGLEEFARLSYCSSFIKERMLVDKNRVLANYKVIKGEALVIEVVQIVTEIKIT